MPAPRVTATRVVYENRWMRLHEDRLERPDGSPGLYAWVEKPPAALIVPLEDGHVWLVEQYRHPARGRYWDLPQGAWEDAPDADAEALARGELAEETGLRARTLEHLGTLFFVLCGRPHRTNYADRLTMRIGPCRTPGNGNEAGRGAAKTRRGGCWQGGGRTPARLDGAALTWARYR